MREQHAIETQHRQNSSAALAAARHGSGNSGSNRHLWRQANWRGVTQQRRNQAWRGGSIALNAATARAYLRWRHRWRQHDALSKSTADMLTRHQKSQAASIMASTAREKRRSCTRIKKKHGALDINSGMRVAAAAKRQHMARLKMKK